MRPIHHSFLNLRWLLPPRYATHNSYSFHKMMFFHMETFCRSRLCASIQNYSSTFSCEKTINWCYIVIKKFKLNLIKSILLIIFNCNIIEFTRPSINFQLVESSMLKLDQICRQANVMLIFARSYGLTGFVRISLKVICYIFYITSLLNNIVPEET